MHAAAEPQPPWRSTSILGLEADTSDGFLFFFFCSHKTKPSAFPDPGKRLPAVASPRTHHHVRCCLSSSRRFKQETDEFARPDVVSILKGGWFNKAGARDPRRVHKALPVAARGTGEPHPWGGGSADVTLINYLLPIARFHARTHVTWQFEAGSKASPDGDGFVIPQLAPCF